MSKDFNPENHVLLEQSLLKLPQQQMRQTFKTSQKYIERDLAFLNNAASEALESCNSGKASPDDSLSQLDVMISRLQGLKRKMVNLQAEEDVYMRKSKARISHLQALYSISSIEDKDYERWNQIRVNRLLVDDVLRNGYVDTAKALVDANPEIEDLVDMDILVQCKAIETSLRAGRTDECLAWCQENKSYLKKARSSLEYEVRLQQYVEFVRTGKTVDAISYYRKYLVPIADVHFDSVIRIAGMLAFSPGSDQESPYQDLFSAERWNHLAETFVSTHHLMHGITMPSLLQITLSAGLSALKTPSCKAENHPITFVSNYNSSLCPICSPELSELSKSLPYAHHVRSMVDPEPVMLPNGRIYGHQTLMDFAANAGLPAGRVRDPTTGDEWDEKVLRRVYPS
ncbi:CTLH/CRA C-terminal to lish motif domain-containing protein [Myxozyma melibiosi]|uniref:CTLH/CRA C-terminal to lish motif domain-containing protein n=1 Tax=Myxozyma melibiosi TaxID=54550 RepID=A0ABR1F6R0_9ASCO